jgi:hypothetical protein
MTAGFALDWALGPDEVPVPVAAATVYLRTRHGVSDEVGTDRLSIRYHLVVVDHPAEATAFATAVGRVLARASRRAALMAGHALGDDLARLCALSATPLPGVAAVATAWTDRTTHRRGLARMVDTAVEAAPAAVDLGMSPAPALTLAEMPDGRVMRRIEVARAVVERALTIAITATVHVGRRSPTTDP